MTARDDDKGTGLPPGEAAGSGESGRYRQRGRTRADILAAAIGLLRAGITPSMADIAEAAGISRRTVYLHFPTIEQCLIDAQLGLLSESAVGQAIDAADPGGDAEARVAAMIEAIVANARESLPMGRALIKLTVDGAYEPGVKRRGHRRVAWIEKAIAPLKGQLSAPDFERLVSALAVVIGWEALIVLGDIRGLASEEQLRTMLWSARAIIRAALDGQST